MNRSNYMMTQSEIWLHRVAVLTAATTFPLIFIGGLVTSHGAGLAVPDWPTSYGYNMFLFPWKKMVGGIFYEHTHRLIGSLLGFFAIALVLCLYRIEKRSWVKKLGLIALALIILQGLLGGLRVELVMRSFAIYHGCLAQAIFCLLAGISLFTSAWWKRMDSASSLDRDDRLRKFAIWTTTLIFVQLMIGAVMRHTDAGLAIPDFPLMYGKLVPPLNPTALAAINEQRIWKWDLEPVSLQQILVHFLHRLTALVVTVSIFILARRAWKHQSTSPLRKLSLCLVGLVLVQLGLGMSVIWTSKAADIATAHVAVGALTLVTSFLFTLVCFKGWMPTKRTNPIIFEEPERVAV